MSGCETGSTLSLSHTFCPTVACIHVVASTRERDEARTQRVIAHALRGRIGLSWVKMTQWNAAILRRKRGQSNAERHHVGTRPAGERPGRPVVRARPGTHVAHGLGGHARPGAPEPRRQASVGRHLGGPHPPRVQGAPVDQGGPLARHGLLPDPVPHAGHGLRAAARANLHAASPRPFRAVGVADRGLRVGWPGRHRPPDGRAPARRARHGRRGGPVERQSGRRCRRGGPDRHPALVPDQAPPA